MNNLFTSGPRKTLCDSIMAFVVDRGMGAKFGVNGVVNSFEKKASQGAVCEVLEYLLSHNYLKYVGQYAFGLGVGTDIEQYSFSDFANDAYFPKPSAEHLLAYQQLFVADTGKAPKKPKQARKPKPEKKAKPPLDNTLDIPAFTAPKVKNAHTDHRLEEPAHDVYAELDQLGRKLQPPDIKDRELKCNVLMQLSKLMGPSTSKVLNEIRSDYEGRSL